MEWSTRVRVWGRYGVFFAAWLCCICSMDEARGREDVAYVQVQAVSKERFVDTLFVRGNIRGKKQDLRFSLKGVVKELKIHEGQQVAEGQVLAILDEDEINMKIKYRNAKLDLVEAGYKALAKQHELAKGLLATGSIIPTRVEAVKLELDSKAKEIIAVQIEIEAAQHELRNTVLKAPFAGFIAEQHVEVGALVDAHATVVTIVDNSSVTLDAGMLETQVTRVSVGQPVAVSLEAYPGQTFTGLVSGVVPMVGEDNRRVKVVVSLENPEGQLYHGMHATGKIQIYESKETITVPKTALAAADDGYSLWRVAKDNTLQKVTVRPVYVAPDRVEVGQELSAGDQVVLENRPSYLEGQKVVVVQ